MPAYHELMNPVIRALHELGGSGTVKEIENSVVELEKIPNKIADIPHGNGSSTEIGYKLAWALTYLKKYGLLENSKNHVWAFVSDKNDVQEVDPKAVVKFVRDTSPSKSTTHGSKKDAGSGDDESWRDELMNALLGLSPDAFERLAKRMLRESGFDSVEVTGRSGDGGVDGWGVFKMSGLISFKVMFQCKRWQKSVPAKEIRDFGGALRGRGGKGLFITTSTFTKDAVKEASRDGAEIDLMDGTALVEQIKNLGLGVNIVERVEVDGKWLEEI